MIIFVIIFLAIFFRSDGGGGGSARFGSVSQPSPPTPPITPVAPVPPRPIESQPERVVPTPIKSIKPKLILTSPRDNKQKPVLIRSSRGEAICRQTLEDYYGVPFPRVRPSFLRNPATGRFLELDCYNADLKIACEYNGIQHNVYPNWTGHSKEQFIEQAKRDQLKWELCHKEGVYLITVPHTIRVEHIPDYVISYLPHNYKKRLDAGLTES